MKARWVCLVALLVGCSGGQAPQRTATAAVRDEVTSGAAAARTEPPESAGPARSVVSVPEPASAAPAPPEPDYSGVDALRCEAQSQLMREQCPEVFQMLPYGAHPSSATGAVEPSASAEGVAHGPGVSATAEPPIGRFVPIEPEASLEHFHRALRRLADGDDEDGKVRILAYGASHTQADLYTSYWRSYLQSRFGDGGIGFLFLGKVNAWHRPQDAQMQQRLLRTRHLVIRPDLENEPLGLMGAALAGRYGNGFGELTTEDDCASTQFELHYLKQPRGGDFALSVDGKTIARIRTRASANTSGYHAFALGPGSHRIRAQMLGNGPVRLFGLVAETDRPGVVVDTLGIGGSQMSDNLKWNEELWVDAVRRRAPDLVTFAYGTNEVMSGRNLSDYENQLRRVVARLRRAAPEASCVFIGPFDVRGRRGKIGRRFRRVVKAQRAIAAEVGCGFWDGVAFMGGAGAIQRWASSDPPLAQADHIHLTPRGYVCAGMALGDALMMGYDLAVNPASEAAIATAPIGSAGAAGSPQVGVPEAPKPMDTATE